MEDKFERLERSLQAKQLAAEKVSEELIPKVQAVEARLAAVASRELQVGVAQPGTDDVHDRLLSHFLLGRLTGKADGRTGREETAGGDDNPGFVGGSGRGGQGSNESKRQAETQAAKGERGADPDAA